MHLLLYRKTKNFIISINRLGYLATDAICIPIENIKRATVHTIAQPQKAQQSADCFLGKEFEVGHCARLGYSFASSQYIINYAL